MKDIKLSAKEEKKMKRLENKKRKIEAFLNVAEMNESDRKRSKATSGEPDSTDINADLRLFVGEKKLSMGSTGAESQDFKEDYAAVKEKYREHKRQNMSFPSFRLKTAGEEALLTRPKEARVPLFISDLQALLTFCLVGDEAPYHPHRWCCLPKWNRLTNVVCLVIEGVGTTQMEQFLSKPQWKESNLQFLEVVSPRSYGSTIVDELALVPTSKRKLDLLVKKHGSLEAALQHLDSKGSVKALFPTAPPSPPPPSTSSTASDGDGKSEPQKQPKDENSLKLRLLLSAKQMLIEGYPLPINGVSDAEIRDFVYTKDVYKEVHENSELFSVDCEMCITSAGSELTKICVVNEQMEVVYKSLVKPYNPISNYLTRFSGVTASDLEDVETRLEDVQEALRKLLPRDCILVGQSLNFDLKALRMMHPYVIDTAVIFNITGDRRRKTKLSTLTNIFLERDIQVSGPEGHCPEEDARAALELTLLKLKEGYHFGDVINGGNLPGFQPMTQINALQERDPEGSPPAKKKCNKLDKSVGISVMTSLEQGYRKFPDFLDGTTFSTDDLVDDVIETGKQFAFQHHMSITHVDLSSGQSTVTAAKNNNSIPASPRDDQYTKTNSSDNKDIKCQPRSNDEDLCSRLAAICDQMYSHTSMNGLFVMILGGGDTRGNNAVAAIKLV
eukprot:TRINITY_DN1811_c0_g1_i13.p1 TRINITY_DN1811_c0_g1~~TRINITY_DN1811_c0_g1_i13.p1  ORF type:complete len:671 (-),score=163.23 TRINITY_DN1811_c0_g1_i13:344-2356(-)